MKIIITLLLLTIISSLPLIGQSDFTLEIKYSLLQNLKQEQPLIWWYWDGSPTLTTMPEMKVGYQFNNVSFGIFAQRYADNFSYACAYQIASSLDRPQEFGIPIGSAPSWIINLPQYGCTHSIDASIIFTRVGLEFQYHFPSRKRLSCYIGVEVSKVLREKREVNYLARVPATASSVYNTWKIDRQFRARELSIGLSGGTHYSISKTLYALGELATFISRLRKGYFYAGIQVGLGRTF